MATGAPDCTFSYVDAGEVFLDELAGIDDYDDFWNKSYTRCKAASAENHTVGPCAHNKEYVEALDKGIGTTFWDGKRDKAACARRVEAVERLFERRFPGLRARIP